MALAWLRPRLGAWLSRATLDDDGAGGVVLFVRRDMLHLDADALNDRLAAWTVRELRKSAPHAEAFVSFRHARPATWDDAELDLQEKWHDLEPTLRLEMESPRPHEKDLAAFAAAVPSFFALIDRDDRPEGWRRVDEGNAE